MGSSGGWLHGLTSTLAGIYGNPVGAEQQAMKDLFSNKSDDEVLKIVKSVNDLASNLGADVSSINTIVTGMQNNTLGNLATGSGPALAAADSGIVMADASGGSVRSSFGLQQQHALKVLSQGQLSGKALMALDDALGGPRWEDAKQGIDVWAQMLGAHEAQNTIKEYAGYRSNSYGITLGADTQLRTGLKVGLAFTVADGTSIKSRDALSKTYLKTHLINFYGSYSPHKTWFVDTSVGGGIAKFRGNRLQATDLYKNQHHGKVFNGMLSSGYNIKIGPGFFLTPYGLAQGSITLTRPYTETGGSLPVSPNGTRITSLRLGGGLKMAMAHALSNEWALIPQGSLSYMRELNPNARTLRATWANAAIPLRTSSTGAHIVDLGLGMTIKAHMGFKVSANYNATIKKAYLGHAGTLKVAYQF